MADPVQKKRRISLFWKKRIVVSRSVAPMTKEMQAFPFKNRVLG